jgi:hypothetical protein
MPGKLANPLQKVEQAEALLVQNGVHKADVIRTGDPILFVEEDGTAWTAWLSADRRSILRLDRGFVADYE